MKFRILMQCLIVGVAFPAMAGNWPAWRGADATGISDETGLPVRWSNTDNIRWKVPLAEPCNSTPIVWDDRIFLTQGLDKGKRRALIALNRKTGKTLWQQEVTCDVDLNHDTQYLYV